MQTRFRGTFDNNPPAGHAFGINVTEVARKLCRSVAESKYVVASRNRGSKRSVRSTAERPCAFTLARAYAAVLTSCGEIGCFYVAPQGKYGSRVILVVT